MNNENTGSSQSERFVDETLAKTKKSLRNTTYALWIVFSLVATYLIVLNHILLKSTNEAMAIIDLNSTHQPDFWTTTKKYAENAPDLKEEKYKKYITNAEAALKWADSKKGKSAINKYRGDLAKLNDPKFYNSVTNQLAKTQSMVSDIIQFDVNRYTNQIERAQMLLDLINEANDTEKIASRIGRAVVNELDTQGNVVAHYATELLSENLDTLPEWVKAQIPKHSNRLQDKTELWINQFCVATSDELGTSFDTFLDAHSEKIKAFSEATDDETALQQLDEELTVMVSTFMRTTPIKNHGSLDDQSQQFLKRIEAANAMLKPLVENKREDLTPDQQVLRHTIAIFMNKMDSANFNEKN